MARVWLLMLTTLSLNACCCVFGYIRGDDTAYFLTMDPYQGFYLTSMENTFDVTKVLSTEDVGRRGLFCTAALDIRNNMFFWTNNYGDNGVWRKSLDSGESRKMAGLTERYTPAIPALDWVHGLLYWTDIHAVHVATYDGSRSARLLTSPHLMITMACDPTRSALYIGVHATYGDPETGIYRVGMDGSNYRRIISLDTNPVALVVDLPEDRLYWVKQGDPKCIQSARTDGSDVTNVACSRSIAYAPDMMGIFRDYVYVGARFVDDILRVKKTGGEIETAASLSMGVNGISIIHPDLQPSYPNQCGDKNGGCDYLCLPSPRTDGQAPHPTCLAADSA